MRFGALDLAATKPVDVTATEAATNQIKRGAFYVVRGNGNRRLVGRGALAPLDRTVQVVFPDLLFEIVPDSARLDPVFLRWAWDSPRVRNQIEEKAQTSAGIYKINQANLAMIRVPLPDLPEQRRVAAELNERAASIARLQNALAEKLAALELLPSKLLATAFSDSLPTHGEESQETHLAVVR